MPSVHCGAHKYFRIGCAECEKAVEAEADAGTEISMEVEPERVPKVLQHPGAGFAAVAGTVVAVEETGPRLSIAPRLPVEIFRRGAHAAVQQGQSLVLLDEEQCRLSSAWLLRLADELKADTAAQQAPKAAP